MGPDKDTSWYQAKRWVEKLRAREGGWRMPTKEELKGISIKGIRKAGPTYLPIVFITTGTWVWSSDRKGPSHAWYFNYFNGMAGWNYHGTYIHSRAFAVRSRK